MRVLIINGPNLNLLGKREKIYGELTLKEIEELLLNEAQELGMSVDFFQSNHEGELVDAVQSAIEKYEAIVINPGGLTHYSVSLRDALSAFPGIKIEVHLTNIFAREPFRQVTVTGGAVDAVIAGLSHFSYILALRALKEISGGRNENRNPQ